MKKKKSSSLKNTEKLTTPALKQFFQEIVDFPDNLARVKDGLQGLDSDSTLDLPVWSHLYDYPFNQHLSVVVKQMELAQITLNAAEGDRPDQEFIDSLPDVPENPLTDPNKPDSEKARILSAIFSMIHNMHALRVHACSMNHLALQAREGDDSCIFKMLRIDRTAVGTPSIVKRLAQAQESSQTDFLKKFASALEIKKKPREPTTYDDLNFVLASLEETHGLDYVPKRRLYEMAVKHYKLYPTHGKSDVEDSFHRFVRNFKRRHRRQ